MATLTIDFASLGDENPFSDADIINAGVDGKILSGEFVRTSAAASTTHSAQLYTNDTANSTQSAEATVNYDTTLETFTLCVLTDATAQASDYANPDNGYSLRILADGRVQLFKHISGTQSFENLFGTIAGGSMIDGLNVLLDVTIVSTEPVFDVTVDSVAFGSSYTDTETDRITSGKPGVILVNDSSATTAAMFTNIEFTGVNTSGGSIAPLAVHHLNQMR